MFSHRFNRPVILTRHAVQRMGERDISSPLLLEVIETGAVRYSDPNRLWVSLHVPQRDDNLLCAVLILEDAVVVKTVMHHWELTP